LTKQSRDPGDLTGPVTFLLLILIALVVIRGAEAPPVTAQKAPDSQFSTELAMRDVRAIAKQPHPIASAEHERVRDYIVARLRALGTNPEVQTVTVARHPPFGPETWAVVRNVMATIPGSPETSSSAKSPPLKSTGAVLMVAHYDSVPSGPGAADDAASVAAILETIRALKVGPALRNDLIVLFTDGEENGLLGAKGFVETYPALREIKVALNFEFRGDRGPSMLFQTSPRDLWLVRQFAAAAPYPRATSAAASVYRMMPNDTDLTVFLETGMDGMNFAASRGITRYHTELDNPDLLDPRSLQHQGSYALSMAQRFGSIELNDPRFSDAVFFVAGLALIHYASRFAPALAFLVTILVAAGLGIGIREERFSPAGVAAGAALYALALAIAVSEARGTWHLMATLAGYRMLSFGTTYGGGYFAGASLAIIFGSLWAIYVLTARWIRVQNLAAGALLVWTVLMLASSIALPGASYVFTWPLLFATLAISYRSGATEGHATFRPAVVALVGLVPGTAILAPAFTANADGTILFLMISGLTAALLFGLFIPYMDLLTSGRRWIVPTVSALFAIVMIVKGNADSTFDASRPRPDCIFYLLDSDRGQARWVSLDSQPDVFTAQFFHRHVRGGWLARLTGFAAIDAPTDTLAKIPRLRDFAYLNHGRTIEGDAPSIKAAPPTIKVLDDTSRDGARVVKVHIASARNAPIVWMAVPFGVKVLGSSIDGKSPGNRRTDGWTGWYWNAPPSGFDLELKLAASGPFLLTVIDQTWGLPEMREFSFTPRLQGTMPTPFLFFDSSTLVRKTIAIGGEALTKR
jgi:hypothetical protein